MCVSLAIWLDVWLHSLAFVMLFLVSLRPSLSTSGRSSVAEWMCGFPLLLQGPGGWALMVLHYTQGG